MVRFRAMTDSRSLMDPPFVPARPVRVIASADLSVGSLLLKRIEIGGSKIAYRAKQSGQWKETTWATMGEQARAFGTWLIDHGVDKGDKVCIVGSTVPEWGIADLGGQLAGAITLGAYPTLTPEQLGYIVDHADAKVVVLEGPDDLAKIQAARDAMPKLEHIVMWSDTSEGVTSFADACATTPNDAALQERMDALKPDDTAIIVYTSGTTGPPKGAMISHRNIMTVLAAQEDTVVMDEDDVSFNFLPMAHVAERILGFYGRINTGLTTYYATSIPKVLEEVQEAKPTFFGSVPRIFEKAYAKMMARVESAPARRQKIFRWAERVGREVVDCWQHGRPVPFGTALQYKLADRLVFSKIRMVFGGRVRYFVTGAAPIAREILDFFWAAGFRIYEVYGMTEATVVTHANRNGMVRLSSVGKALPYVEHRIAEDGEILVKGPMVFQGYYKNPEATAETIIDGWLHTGDIGEIDDDGYLYIKDRKKHIIITAGGKNLTPANIENEIKASDPLISQAHAHGDKRKFLVGLVTIGPSEAIAWALERDLIAAAEAERMTAELAANPLATPEGLPSLMKSVTDDERLQERVVESVRRANSKLARVETIKKVYLLDRELSVEHDELTPTLKVKRKNVEKSFAEIFDRMYEDDAFGLTI